MNTTTDTKHTDTSADSRFTLPIDDMVAAKTQRDVIRGHILDMVRRLPNLPPELAQLLSAEDDLNFEWVRRTLLYQLGKETTDASEASLSAASRRIEARVAAV